MVGTTGFTDRMFGGSGFDWADYKDDKIGVTIDLDARFFDQPPTPGSGASALARFDIMEGLSGSSHNDYLFGDSIIDLVGGEVGAGVNGSALTNIALINGLGNLLDTAYGTHVTAFTTGNILLGGDGNDFMMGRGGDDVIDGDAWLNVRISVRATVDGDHDGKADRDADGRLIQGAEIASYDRMQDMVPLMLNGTYSAGQLKAVREIKYANGPDFDTAVFTGPRANYSFAVNGIAVAAADLAGIGLNSVITVIDNVGASGIGDGTDRVMHVERLQFSDQSIVVGGLDNGPQGTLTILDGVTGLPDDTPTEDQLLRVSIAGVTDADNPGGVITGPVSYFWQAETRPGFFEDITVFAAGELSRIEGLTLTPAEPFPGGIAFASLVGQALRVRAVYQDANGVME